MSLFQYVISIKFFIAILSVLSLICKIKCIFYIYKTTQFGFAAFQVFISLMWLVAAVLDSTVLTDR